jgi:hypothetical protein
MQYSHAREWHFHKYLWNLYGEIPAVLAENWPLGNEPYPIYMYGLNFEWHVAKTLMTEDFRKDAHNFYLQTKTRDLNQAWIEYSKWKQSIAKNVSSAFSILYLKWMLSQGPTLLQLIPPNYLSCCRTFAS